MNPDYPNFFLDMDNPDYNGAWAMSNDGLHVGVMQFTAEWETSTYLWSPNDGYTQLPNGTSTQTRKPEQHSHSLPHTQAAAITSAIRWSLISRTSL